MHGGARSMIPRLPMSRPHVRWMLLGTLAAILLAGVAYAAGRQDPGLGYADQLSAQSQAIFGFGHPIDAAVSGEFFGPGDQAVELAKGLTARIVSDRVGVNADMIALWPNDSAPTDALICNEVDGAVAGAEATFQRVHLADGAVTDMVSGTVSCDPAHRTAWGTIVFGEEAGSSGRI